MENLNKITHLYLSKLGDLENKKITCGFSGGADSTALLYCLAEKRQFFKFDLDAVFFTHGNSPIAVDEDVMFKFCTDFCAERNIPLTVVPLNLEKVKRQGWESSGRKARQNYYKDNASDLVFLGHHKDDQNETTMTQFMRGGGKGASAMKHKEGIYCRPFLNIHKKDIYEYLEALNVSWIEDPTNTNTDFTRNFWRNVGLPTIAQHYPQYSQMLDNFRQHNRELNELAFDMAKTDGLEELYNGQSVNIKELSDTRLKNLIVHYFSMHRVNMEDAFYDQQIKHYRSNNKLSIDQKGITLNISKGVLYNFPIKTLKP